VPVLAEGMEVSLLYVRFRAAAEPSLKGRLSAGAGVGPGTPSTMGGLGRVPQP
jgi:hypothetical protein